MLNGMTESMLVSMLPSLVSPAGTPTDPPPITNNLIFNLDAADLTTISKQGTSLLELQDKSGNGYHISQTDSDYYPVTGVEEVNGLNAISFNGSQGLNFSEESVTAIMALIASGAATLYVTAKRVDHTASGDEYLISFTSGAGVKLGLRWPSASATTNGTFTFSNGGSSVTQGGADTNSTQTYTGYRNGIAQTIVITGAGSTGNTNASNISSVTMGAVGQLARGQAGTQAQNGAQMVFCQALLYSGQHGTTQQNNTRDFLNTKWGV